MVPAWGHDKHSRRPVSEIAALLSLIPTVLPLQLHELADFHWDAIVIGSGMGGATLGYTLARRGWNVLFCERGPARSKADLLGDYAELGATTANTAGLRGGLRWPEPVEDRGPGKVRTFVPFIGSGSGGSSALYGMAMERLFAADFGPAPGGAGAGCFPPSARTWPISYADLEPHYRQAELLYRVRGTPDLLRGLDPSLPPPPPMSPAAAALAESLSLRGLHPYQLPSACEYVAGCTSCQGYLCPYPCKNDSWRVALRPAIEQHGATLLDECEAVQLASSSRTVTGVECVRQGRPLTLKGRVVIVAAGALNSPALLLRSASREWPDGLANRSGLVGRNLMRHLIDLYAVKVPVRQPFDNRRKEIAFNDFYVHEGTKLGTVQSFGRLPPPEMILAAMQEDLAGSGHAWARPLLGLASPALRAYLTRFVDRRLTLASIVEDSADPENRVELTAPASGRIAIRYRISDSDRQRVERMRQLMKAALAPLRYTLIPEAHKNERIAHACGTCRFGDDPRTSVLDRNCKAHGLDNLYVVDASFFPTSGGTNPSLTIAANALRVGEHLAGSRATICAASAP